MSRATLSPPRRVDRGGQTSTWSDLELDGGTHRLAYRVSGAATSAGCEPFLLASLVPAMATAQDLMLPTAVAAQLLAGVERSQAVLSAWYEHLRPVAVEAKTRPPDRPSGGVGCFFSGGVDSFFTVLRHREEITHLVFVCGFDMGLRDQVLGSRVVEALRAAAAELGKTLLVVETNLRAYADHYARWSEEYHGSALASVGYLLAPMLGKVYIPASFSYAMLDPWGSHPLLDPLWTTDTLEIVHDGFETERVAKVAAIAQNETALRWLRVCWENRGGEYNCGRCEKCLRTMVNLQVAGTLDRCRAFRVPLDLQAVATVELPDECARAFVRQNLRALRHSGRDPQLAGALVASLQQRRRWQSAILRRGVAAWRRATHRSPGGSVTDPLASFQFDAATVPWE